jgi:hypothetical protein
MIEALVMNRAAEGFADGQDFDLANGAEGLAGGAGDGDGRAGLPEFSLGFHWNKKACAPEKERPFSPHGTTRNGYSNAQAFSRVVLSRAGSWSAFRVGCRCLSTARADCAKNLIAIQTFTGINSSALNGEGRLREKPAVEKKFLRIREKAP